MAQSPEYKFHDLKPEDLEFEGYHPRRLVKVKGQRPEYMSGWELVYLVHALAKRWED